MDDELLNELKFKLKKEFNMIPFYIISSIKNHGINQLKEGLWEKLNN